MSRDGNAAGNLGQDIARMALEASEAARVCMGTGGCLPERVCLPVKDWERGREQQRSREGPCGREPGRGGERLRGMEGGRVGGEGLRGMEREGVVRRVRGREDVDWIERHTHTHQQTSTCIRRSWRDEGRQKKPGRGLRSTRVRTRRGTERKEPNTKRNRTKTCAEHEQKKRRTKLRSRERDDRGTSESKRNAEQTIDMAPVSVFVKQTGPSGKLEIQVELEGTVGDVKETLSSETLAGVSADRQRLIYKGQILKDERTLSSYGKAIASNAKRALRRPNARASADNRCCASIFPGLEAGHTIHLVKGGGQNSQQASPAAANPAPTPTNQTNTPAAQPSGLGDAGGFQQFQEQMMRNPRMMSDLMESPLMQSMMNNPELMRSIMMNNPQMQQIMERNPELAHIFNNPSVLRQTMEIARNPDLLREQMRNTDRAMSNIEAHPEGFNMLRRMYENVQEPMMSASVAPEDTENPFSDLFQPQQSAGTPNPTGSPNTAPLPNPWAPAGNQGRHQAASNTAQGTPASGTQGAAARGTGTVPGLGMSPEQMRTMMQSPMMQQMLQSLSSNPQLFESMLNANPQTRSLLESNPEMRSLLANPEFLRVMMDPNNMQAMMQMEQAMGQLRGSGFESFLNGSQTDGANAPSGGATNPPDLSALMGLLGSGAAAPPPPENPESAYATQLQQLKDMGFYDVQENIRALVAARGNVNEAIERLLSSGH